MPHQLGYWVKRHACLGLEIRYTPGMHSLPCPVCGDILPVGSFCSKDGTRVAPPFGTGTILEQYSVEAKIGVGGMAEVWRARHVTNKRLVAVKVFTPDLQSNATLVARFQREFETINELHHKNLVEVLSFGQLPNGIPYFIMEMLEGKSLRQQLRENAALSLWWISLVFDQICRGLQVAHDKNIIHRDLKPDNIFLVGAPDCEMPTVKLLDFGIAKLKERNEPGHTLTRTGSVFGTPAYMSPEQCSGAKNVDSRSDIYSLGVVLFEMICGRTPFADESDGSGLIIAKQITAPVPNLSQFTTRKLSAELENFVKKALSKDPEERPQSATQFAKELSQVLDATLTPEDTRTIPTRVIALPQPPSTTTQLPNDDKDFTDQPTTLSLISEIRPPTTSPKPRRALMLVGLVAFLLVGPLFYFLLSPVQEAPKITLTVSTIPTDARLTLDGTFIGNSPLSKILQAQEKSAILQIEKDGFLPVTKTILLSRSITINEIALEPIEPVSAPVLASTTSAPTLVGETPKKKNPCDDVKCPTGQICYKGSCVAPIKTTNQPTPAQIEMMDNIRSMLAGNDCPSAVAKIQEYQKEFGTDANVYYYRAYCYRDSNPSKACTNYLSFLKIAKSDSRAGAAKAYISTQDREHYPPCVLP
jgi:serine/threonine protein kinase